MPRPPRLLVTGFPHHVVQRGHNGRAVFIETRDCEYYLENLAEWKQVYKVAVHAWCLMTNHVHLVLTPNGPGEGVSRLMRRLSARQGRYLNRLEQRVGTLWSGRFRSSVIDTDRYLLACLRYVELNPVRAALVRHPADYPWSSYGERMGSAPPRLLDIDPATAQLGATVGARRAAYAEFIEAGADVDQEAFIRTAVRRNQLTGGRGFVDEIARRTAVRIVHRGPGRPRRAD